MYLDALPLYPGMERECEKERCVRLPLFDGGGRAPSPADDGCGCRRVTIENPCRPGEWAEVLLSVDECGNLRVCVRRDPRWDCDGHRRDRRGGRECRPRCGDRPPRPCPPPAPPRGGCGGRLYGSWR